MEQTTSDLNLTHMKTIGLTAFLSCLLLVCANSPAQQSQPVSSTPDAVSTVLVAGSNAPAIVLLTNQLAQTLPASSTTTLAMATMAGATIESISTNAAQPVRMIRLQGQISAPAPQTPIAGQLSVSSQSSGVLNSLTSGSGCVRPGSGLVSWWAAEGDTSDRMGHNAGVPVGGVSFASGMVGQAFNFDGQSGSVQIPYSASLTQSVSFTWEMWVNPSAQVGSQAVIFGQSYSRALVARPGSQGLSVAFLLATDPWHWHELDCSYQLPIGQWSHLAVSFDGTYMRLFTNGVLNAQGAPGIVPWDSGCAYSIGGFQGAYSCGYSGQYFPGKLDEVSLYDRALFPGEIQAIYQAGAAGKCTGAPACVACPASAISWWPAEGDASDAFRAHNGTLPRGAGFAPGMVGQAFSFDGISQTVRIPYAPSSPSLVPPSFSFEAWVDPAAAQINNWLGQATLFAQAFSRAMVVRSGNLGPKVAFLLSPDSYSWYELSSSQEIPVGQWTHLVGTYDGATTTMSLYVNGALDQQAQIGTQPFDSLCDFALGGFDDACGYDQFFPGLLDEVTLYGSALAPSDVAALYKAGSAGKCNIPGAWLAQYFGPNYATNPDAAINADPDGDGLTNIQEYQMGTDPTDYYNGILPQLTIVSGDGQSGSTNDFLPLPLAGPVTGANGSPLTNAPVDFAATPSTLSLRTDTNGEATIWLTSPGSPDGSVTVTATAQSGTYVTSVAFTESFEPAVTGSATGHVPTRGRERARLRGQSLQNRL